MTSVGFPHSDIPGSKLACSSPRLFAACHVLHRRFVPRHPPCALIRLTEAPPTSGPFSRARVFSLQLPPKVACKRTPQVCAPSRRTARPRYSTHFPHPETAFAPGTTQVAYGRCQTTVMARTRPEVVTSRESYENSGSREGRVDL